jgi:hypothetical protein
MYISCDSSTDTDTDTDTDTHTDTDTEKHIEKENTYIERPPDSRDLFVVFVINSHYVRWETFLPEENIVDMYNLLRDKYNIDDCIMEIRDYVIFKSYLRKVAHLCKNGGCTIDVTTKNTDYKLDKELT